KFLRVEFSVPVSVGGLEPHHWQRQSAKFVLGEVALTADVPLPHLNEVNPANILGGNQAEGSIKDEDEIAAGYFNGVSRPVNFDGFGAIARCELRGDARQANTACEEVESHFDIS